MDILTSKLDALSDKINIINQNVQFNITIMWTILAVIVGVLAFTMFFLIKSIVNEKVEKELTQLKQSLKTELSNEMKEYVNNNRSLYYACGNTTLANKSFTLACSGLVHMKGEDIIKFKLYKLEIISCTTNKSFEYDLTYRIVNDYPVFDIILKNYDSQKDGLTVNWSIIWVNRFC